VEVRQKIRGGRIQPRYSEERLYLKATEGRSYLLDQKVVRMQSTVVIPVARVSTNDSLLMVSCQTKSGFEAEINSC